jgi:hypothetical protein
MRAGARGNAITFTIANAITVTIFSKNFDLMLPKC